MTFCLDSWNSTQKWTSQRLSFRDESNISFLLAQKEKEAAIAQRKRHGCKARNSNVLRCVDDKKRHLLLKHSFYWRNMTAE